MGTLESQAAETLTIVGSLAKRLEELQLTGDETVQFLELRMQSFESKLDLLLGRVECQNRSGAMVDSSSQPVEVPEPVAHVPAGVPAEFYHLPRSDSMVFCASCHIVFSPPPQNSVCITASGDLESAPPTATCISDSLDPLAFGPASAREFNRSSMPVPSHLSAEAPTYVPQFMRVNEQHAAGRFSEARETQGASSKQSFTPSELGHSQPTLEIEEYRYATTTTVPGGGWSPTGAPPGTIDGGFKAPRQESEDPGGGWSPTGAPPGPSADEVIEPRQDSGGEVGVVVAEIVQLLKAPESHSCMMFLGEIEDRIMALYQDGNTIYAASLLTVVRDRQSALLSLSLHGAK